MSGTSGETVIAVAQLAVRVGDQAGNREAAAAAVREAAGRGARLVVLPELCDSGYVFGDAGEARGLAAPAEGNPTLDQWRALAAAHGLVIAGGFCELGGHGEVYNSAAIVDGAGTRAVYRKVHLWDTEKKIFTPGEDRPPVVPLPFGRVGLVICYDLEFPEWIRLAALDGADLIAAPLNWPAPYWPEPRAAVPAGERPAEVVKAQAQAAINGVFIAVADRCGTERGVAWTGGTAIIGPGGYPLAGPVLADEPAVLTAACDLARARDKRISPANDLFGDRRTALYGDGAEGMAAGADPRVAAASAHWAHRFIANGTDYADVRATLARIGRWRDWCREWGRTAQRHEHIALTAEQRGELVTAGEAWRRAALCWHWAGFVFTGSPHEQTAAHEHSVACFRRCAGTLTPPAEPVRVPCDGVDLHGWLRVPEGAGHPPVVVMIPGLDSVKEELQATAGYFLDRGLAALAIDGPGQGSAAHLAITPDYERVTSAALGFLAGRDDIDRDRTGVFGVSLGGYYAARSAAYVPGLRAAVALSGPYRFDLDWDDLPLQTREMFRVRGGHEQEQDAKRDAARFTLEDAAARITVPLLVAHGGRDRLVPPHHAERLARAAPGAEPLLYADGNHGLTNLAFESRSRIADWLAARLRER